MNYDENFIIISSWGFGGYGRLGHSETGNELVPRLIKFLDGPKRGIRKVVAGGQFNLAISEVPVSLFFKNIKTSLYEMYVLIPIILGNCLHVGSISFVQGGKHVP